MEMAASLNARLKTNIYQPKCVTLMVTYFGRCCSSLDLSDKDRMQILLSHAARYVTPLDFNEFNRGFYAWTSLDGDFFVC